jgi:predicted lipoprotein with Yx(FWY)xxD motif
MRRILALVAACAFLLAACGSDEGESSTDAGGEGSQEQAPATVEVESSDLGDILVDSEGNTLYMFMPDQEQGEPTCYDDCAEAWPAFEASGDLTAGEGLDQSLLASAERTDGATQVSYNDLPLYYFSGDEAAGDTNGQGLNEVWWVMSPEGEPIQDKKTSSEDEGAREDDY